MVVGSGWGGLWGVNDIPFRKFKEKVTLKGDGPQPHCFSRKNIIGYFFLFQRKIVVGYFSLIYFYSDGYWISEEFEGIDFREMISLWNIFVRFFYTGGHCQLIFEGKYF